MKHYRTMPGSIAWYMKNYGRWIIALVLVIAVAITFTAMRSKEIEPQSDELPKVDKVYALEKDTAKNEFKVTGVEDMICIECDKYGVDAELALAIARLETGHFTSEAYIEGHNVGGLTIDEEPMSFTSLERGVEAFVMNLYYNYIQEGLDTVDEIAEKYCPINKEQWADTVKELMN